MTPLEAARAYVAGGLSVIPVGLDGLKQPAFDLLPRVPDPKKPDRFVPTWKPYQDRPPTDEELVRWYGQGQAGIAVVCGVVSGGAECIDVDAVELVEPMRRQVLEDMPDLADRLTWIGTGRGSAHCWYRCAEVEGNQELALRPPTPEERAANPKLHAVVLMETRGEGGYAVAPGSPPQVHKSGRPYKRIAGPMLTELQEITVEERSYLLRLACSFNIYVNVPSSKPSGPPATNLSPGDDYDLRGPSWEQLLADLNTGAEFATGGGNEGRVRRPGKEKGWSATAGYCHGSRGEPLLYVFTTGWAPFQSKHSYGKFNVLKLLRFDGNGAATARWLREQGFGGAKNENTVSVPGVYRAGTETETDGAPSGQDHSKSTTPAPAVFPDPIPASLLKTEQPGGDWLWWGIFARRSVTLFSALWKAGKTTLLAHLLRSLCDGGHFCGRKVTACRTLYVTEEPETLWARRRDDLGITDAVHFQVRPFRVKPRLAEWIAFMAHLRQHVVDGAFDLVMLDTFANLGPLRDENDAGLVSEALMPLNALTDTAGVGLVHHVRKGDGQEATASRGSGALPAFVDTIVELRRYDPTSRKDCRRVLTGYGRYEETPEEIVIELTKEGYVDRGDRRSLAVRSVTEVLLDILPGEPPGWTYHQITDKWPEDRVPRRDRMLETLRTGVDAGRWHQEGEGRRGSPWRYWRDGNQVPGTSLNGHAGDELPDDPAFG